MFKVARTLKTWGNVYKRIRYFRRMYPISTMIKEAVTLPFDYLRDDNDISTVRNVTMLITHACNIRCEMCYFHEELGNKNRLPFDVFKSVVDEVKATRPSIQFTGGEPFTHPQLPEMIEYAKSQGLPVQVFTNGILVRPEVADRITAAGLDYLNMTLLGNPESHSQVARMPKAYEKLRENLEYVAANRGNTHIILNYTITPRALHDVDHAIKLVKELKLDGLRIQHYMFLRPGEFQAQYNCMMKMYGEPGAAHEAENDENTAWMAAEMRALRKRLTEDHPDINVQWAPTLSDSEIDNWYAGDRFETERKCLYPWRGIHVDADGKVYPCTKIYVPLGNAATEPVLTAWNSARMKDFRKNLKKSLYPACSRCCKL